MRRRRNISRRSGEQGVVILLVALVLLFVVGAMAVLAIDLVTFYTARSEAQLAADSAALAGARAMANSGVTSNPTDSALVISSELMAKAIAEQVAQQNMVGGRTLNSGAGEIVVASVGSSSNPQIRVKVTRNDLPTFFARIWGRSQITVTATATAEAYSPVSSPSSGGGATLPIAPLCVKPWLLPNVDPTGTTSATIFDPSLGTITNPGLLGATWPDGPSNPNGLFARCSDCSGAIPAPLPGQYYPGAIDAADFPAPAATQVRPSCGSFNAYQLAVAGCVQRPIACGSTAIVNIDVTPYGATRDADTVAAVKCLIHDNGAVGDSDSIDPTWTSGQPFQFLAGNANPVATAVGQKVPVSSSLVTVPVFDSSGGATSSVTVIGFVQLLLNPQANPITGTQIPVMIINMAGCGTTASGQPILGNGGSAIPVRLITSP